MNFLEWLVSVDLELIIWLEQFNDVSNDDTEE